MQVTETVELTQKPWLNGLREYQLEARRQIIQAWKEGDRAVLLQLCTGAGKSVIIRSILSELYLKGKKALVVSHDTRILTQLVGHALDGGIPETQIGILKAWKSGKNPLELHKPIQVSMIQSLSGNWDELQGGLFKLEPDLIIIDEAHHCSADTNYIELWERFPEARILGVTATPARPNKEGFYFHTEKGQPKKYLFDRLIKGVEKRYLIDQGYLPECETYFGLTPSLKGVAKSRGDYKIGGNDGLANRYDQADIRGDIIKCWKEFVLDRFGAAPTVCFGVSVEHIVNIAAEFNANGIPAIALHGGLSDSEQAEVLKSFITQENTILTLCGMGQEGFDLASLAKTLGLESVQIFCCVKALATQSLVKNSQLDGRVRGIDLMQWDWRGLPTKGEISDIEQRPHRQAVVLGGSTGVIQGSMVLGGIDGIKAMLASPNIGARAAGVKRCISTQNFDLLLQHSKEANPQLKSLIEAVLENKELASKQKLLYGVIIDCGNNLEKHGAYDDEHEWSLDGVKPKPQEYKSCPKCKLEAIRKNASLCPSCGYKFIEVIQLVEGGEATGNSPREIRHNKAAQMAMLDKQLWRSWKNLKSRSWNDFDALQKFVRTGASIQEIVLAGKDCKNKEGKTFRPYAIYKMWFGAQQEIHGKDWIPQPEVVKYWEKLAGFKRGWAKHEIEKLTNPTVELQEVPVK